MGFGGKSRKAAKAAQDAAYQQQLTAYQNSQDAVNAYNSNYDTRNAPIIGMQGNAQDWLNKYNKGVDVSELNPAAVKTAQQAADQVKGTMDVANNLGSNALAKGDRGYQSRLNSLNSREISKGLASVNVEGLLSELGNQRGILTDTSQFLNADRQAGLGYTNQLYGMTDNMYQNATNTRQMEMQRGNLMNQMLMDGIFGGLSGAASAFGGTGGFSSLFGKKK